MTSVRRALALSFLERYLSIMLALASNMVLARLLTPHEIGLYSVTLAVIGVAQVLRDFGIGNWLIQEKEVTDAHVGTAFGVSLLLGCTLFVLVVLLAPIAARFYGEPGMVTTMRIAALNFLVLPFCTIRMSLLRREMRFNALLYISLAATIVSLVVTVTLASLDFGADSMAVGSVVLNLTTALGTWFASGSRRLTWPTLALWRPLLNFGGQSAFTNVLTTVSMDANDLVVGKVLGFPAVAMISKAQGLVNLFHRDVMGSIRNVAMPAFARAHREGAPLAARYRESVTLLTAIAWPFYGLLAIYSLEAVRLLFGPQWGDAVPLVPLFCLLGMIGALNSLLPTLLLAMGRISLVTTLELAMQPLRLIFVVIASIVFRSLDAVAYALLLSAALTVPFAFHLAQRAIPDFLTGLASALWPSLVITVAVSAPSLALALSAGVDRVDPLPALQVAGCIGAGLVFGLCAAHLVSHPVVREPAYAHSLRTLLKFAGRANTLLRGKP